MYRMYIRWSYYSEVTIEKYMVYIMRLFYIYNNVFFATRYPVSHLCQYNHHKCNHRFKIWKEKETNESDVSHGSINLFDDVQGILL